MGKMRFRINDKVLDMLTGKECIIVGNKQQPYYPKNDYLNEGIKPEDGCDYLIMLKVDDNGKDIEYSGLRSAMDNQLNEF